MKIYKSNEEVNKDIVDGVLIIKGDVKFDFYDLVISASIEACGITANNINTNNITANNITAYNINTNNITAYNIYANNIYAGTIDYYAVCFANEDIVCTRISGRRENSKHFCLDGKITIREPEKKKVTLELTDEQLEKITEILEE